jgi:hypothetical protein
MADRQVRRAGHDGSLRVHIAGLGGVFEDLDHLGIEQLGDF